MSAEIKNVRCALHLPFVPEICQSINSALESKFSYVICPLIHPRFKREHFLKKLKHQSLPLTRSDLLLSAECWQNYVVGKISKNYNFDSEDELTRRNAIESLIEELKFASHLSLSAFIIPIQSGNVENLAKTINNMLVKRQILFNLLISVPLESDTRDVEIENDMIESDTAETTWHWWRKFRTLCEESSRIGVILGMNEDLSITDAEVDRWLAEPVKAIRINTSLFLTNKSGFPVLSKPHQKLINKFFKLDVDVIIEGINRHPDKGMNKYVEYLQFLHRQAKQTNNELAHKYTKGYEDCLQNPLQPLMDNLESQVYEIFEKDPVKYVQYQKAIAEALLDRVSDSEKLTKQTIIMVVGAGRGPLVKAALQAAYETERKVKLFAIEKNPNAVNTLLNLKNDVWGGLVEVIASDMRDWVPSEKADILVSELLGSFGDNELSPECLDGAMALLKQDGISIPYRYRSFIAPVQSHKIYSEIKNCIEYKHPYEAPYVVLLHNHCRIDDEKILFEFHHPSQPDKIDNACYGKVEFKAKFDATIHGFGGYFDSHLYKDVDISITPKTHSPGLFSWFPMFFPLDTPIDVKTGDSIVVHFWRHVSPKQVHYEWCVTSPVCSKMHNPNGRTYYIGL